MKRFSLSIRLLPAALLLGTTAASHAAEDFKITLLEQAVRELQREVQAQAQQIDALRRQLSLPAGQPAKPATQGPASTPGQWVDATRWQQLRPGMGELEVISILGPPTSMREAGEGQRVLLYAMEIGASGFLGGSVTLRDRAVIDIQMPLLK